MFPEPTELRLTGQTQMHWHQNPTRRHTDQRETSHVTNEIIFCVCSTSAISVLQIVLKWCQKERKKNQVKKESQQIQDQWWVWLQGLPQLFHLRHQKAKGREVMKVKVFWVCKLRNMLERWNPLLAVTQATRQATTRDLLKARRQHTTLDGTMTKLGLLKSGKLMNWWMIERWNPLFALNEEQGHNNSSLETTKQNWIYR